MIQQKKALCKSALDFSLNVLASALMCAGLITAAHADVYVKETSTGAGIDTTLSLPVNSYSPADYFVGIQNISVSPNSDGAGATSFAAYCVDVENYSSISYLNYMSPSTTNNVTSVYSAQASSNIENLFNLYYAGTITSGPNQNSNAAAFQLALWDLSQPSLVQTTGSTDQTLISNVNNLLNNLTYTGPALYNLTVYQVDRSISGAAGQDYIVAQPVPEPENYALLLSGLGVLGFAQRRSKKKRSFDSLQLVCVLP